MIFSPACAGIGAQGFADLEAGFLRHHHVEQDQIRIEAGDAGKRLLAVTGDRHLETLLLHQELERDDDVRLVVDDQYLVRHV